MKRLLFSLVVFGAVIVWSPGIVLAQSDEAGTSQSEGEPDVAVEEETNEPEFPEEENVDLLGGDVPEEPLIPTDFLVEVDPTKFLSAFQGQGDIAAFSGSSNYTIPIVVPEGRNGLTPQVSLLYSSLNRSYTSPVGYGWSLPMSGVFRTQRQGVDTMYDQEVFSVNLFGQVDELVVVDSAQGVYMAKDESGFTRFTYDGTSWSAVDRDGTTYVFGVDVDDRQANPEDANQVYKWFLESVTDAQGNAMIFTYADNGFGELYPQFIYYGGTNVGNAKYKISFSLTDRPAYKSHKTGYGVTYDSLVESIHVTLAQTAVEVVTYTFTYEQVSAAIQLLTAYQVSTPDLSLPSAHFAYFDGTESGDGAALHRLRRVEEIGGSIQEFRYQPASHFREQDRPTNLFPYAVMVVVERSLQADENSDPNIYTYHYEHGQYYIDQDDVHVREYAGFGKITISDPLGNRTVHYYHQSDTDPHNSENATTGEFEDHIDKRGRLYRTEVYENNSLVQVKLATWDREPLSDEDPDRERSFVFLSTDYVILYKNAGYDGVATTYTYDGLGNVLTQTQWGSVAIDIPGFSFTDIGTDRRTTMSEYAVDPAGEILGVPSRVILKDESDSIVSDTRYFYDHLNYGQVNSGLMTKKSQWTQGVNFVSTSYTYDSHGNVLTITQPSGTVTSIEYDSDDFFPRRVENDLGHVTELVFDDATGKLTSRTNPNGGVETMTYDGLGRPLAHAKSQNNSAATMTVVSEWSYQDAIAPRSTTTTTHLDATTSGESIVYYDGLHRTIETRVLGDAGEYVVTGIAYDELGREKVVRLPEFRTGAGFEGITTASLTPATDALARVSTYDVLSRITEQETAVGRTTNAYDGAFKTTTTDANGNEKRYQTDGLGRLVEVVEVLDAGTQYTTQYAWTANDLLARETDAQGNIRTFTYDGRGLMTVMTDLHHPSDTAYGTYAYAYDADGRLEEVTDPAGDILTYVYDHLGRVVQEDFSGTASIDVSSVYDGGSGCQNPVGMLCQSVRRNTDGTAVATRYSYDDHGRVESATVYDGVTAWTQGYIYDYADHVTRTTLVDGSTTQTTYNILGLPQAVTYTTGGTEHAIVTSVEYAPTGAARVITYGNGMTTTRVFDESALYRLSSLVTHHSGTDTQDFTYAYDAVGNVKTITDRSDSYAERTLTLTYDALNRLRTANQVSADASADFSKTYTYNGIGGIASATGLGVYAYQSLAPGNYANPHAPTNIGLQTFVYDQLGRMIQSGNRQLSWDYTSRPVETTVDNKTVQYAYDAQGNRTKKTNTDTSEVTDTPFEEYRTDGVNTFVNIVVPVLGNIASFRNNTYLVYSLKDHLGSSHVDIHANGTLVESTTYLPFGSIDDHYLLNGATENPDAFLGKEQDAETGLLNLEARMYNPAYGVFLSADPVFLQAGGEHRDTWLTDPQIQNAYAYSRNNPYTYVDPEGEFGMLFQASLSWAARAFFRTPFYKQNQKEITQASISLTPVVGDAMDIAEVLTGKDVFTGRSLTPGDRLLTGVASFVPILSGRIVRYGADAIRHVSTSDIGSYKDLINAAGELSTLKNGQLQGFVKGHIKEIFDSITSGAKTLESGAKKLDDGVHIHLYQSSTTQEGTIHINDGANQYKIRFNED